MHLLRHRPCSSWENFHKSLVKAKQLLEDNQYPPHFYERIIDNTIKKLVKPEVNQLEKDDEGDHVKEKMVFVQYRGRVSGKVKDSLKRINAPSRIVFTIRKLKTVLPSLKPPMEMSLKSRVVYHIKCSGCEACYVGQTDRHLITWHTVHLVVINQNINIECTIPYTFYSLKVKNITM